MDLELCRGLFGKSFWDIFLPKFWILGFMPEKSQCFQSSFFQQKGFGFVPQSRMSIQRSDSEQSYTLIQKINRVWGYEIKKITTHLFCFNKGSNSKFMQQQVA